MLLGKNDVPLQMHNKKFYSMSKKGTITTSDYLPYEEYQRLVENLENDGNYRGAAYCIMSFAFGLRICDVLKIRWCQVVGPTSLVITEKKTRKTKRVTIGANTSAKLRELFHKIKDADYNEPVVLNRWGKVMSPQYINRWLKDCKVKYNLQIDNFSSHTFRKTLGRYVYNKMGRSQEALILLNRIFRHASVNTTMVYLGLRDDEINEVFDML